MREWSRRTVEEYKEVVGLTREIIDNLILRHENEISSWETDSKDKNLLTISSEMQSAIIRLDEVINYLHKKRDELPDKRMKRYHCMEGRCRQYNKGKMFNLTYNFIELPCEDHRYKIILINNETFYVDQKLFNTILEKKGDVDSITICEFDQVKSTYIIPLNSILSISANEKDE